MSEEEKDAIDVLENVFIFKNTNDRFTKLDLKCINIALNLIKTQNKMIELMAKDIKDADDYIYSELNESEFSDYNVEEIIEYFRTKAKEK